MPILLIIIETSEDLKILSEEIKLNEMNFKRQMEELKQKADRANNDFKNTNEYVWNKIGSYLLGDNLIEDTKDKPVLEIRDGVIYMLSKDDLEKQMNQDLPTLLKSLFDKGFSQR